MKQKYPGRIFIGTSGWHYKHWKPLFYPDGTDSLKYLELYAGKLACVEINNTFYVLPKKETLNAWKKRVPGEFRFAVKASRYITHFKKLKVDEEPVRKFLDTAVI